MIRPLHRLFFSTLLIALCAAACKPKAAPETQSTDIPADTTQTYLSIREFVKDQVNLLYGQPYGLTQITTKNGVTDSALVNFYNMDLGWVLRTFLATDIGTPAMLGKYRFSNFKEETTGNQILMYEAKEPELFTRTFTVTVDATNDKILSVYLETQRGESLHQKLLYVPLKVIQIQETEGRMIGKTNDLRVEYRFLQ